MFKGLAPCFSNGELFLVVPEDLVVALSLLHPFLLLMFPLSQQLQLLLVQEERLAGRVLAEVDTIIQEAALW